VKSISNKYFSVNYGVYVIAIASLLGWIVFSMFGGVGLIALPFDAFMSFKYRPRPIKLAE
jgi:LMBR1 domain-containing protein 1